jgi:phosphoribosyl-ATP pyrophosphohydrolase
MARSDPQILGQLMAVIQDRKTNPPTRSYTTQLFEGGVEAIGKKVTEEAAEVIAAAHAADTAERRDHLAHEAADLIYHLFVMLAYRGVSLADVEGKIAARFGISGLDEKASRSNKP